ncbi:MAG: DUF2723 domain-containing protein [Myxococcales bacterium]|nr:DUF2723 domain-containing protein [Myxococcales bacterium]
MIGHRGSGDGRRSWPMSTLFLPLDDRKRAWTLTALLAVYYLATMCRDMSQLDSPELALAAYQLGLGHPFGQPSYMLLGWLFSHLPGIEPLHGLGALSALCSALCLVPALSLAEHFARGGDATAVVNSRWLYPAVAVVALHGALWEPASRIEVYPLASFFALWGIALLARLLSMKDQARRARPALDWGVGLLFGLAAVTHLFVGVLSATAVAPRLLALLLRRELPLQRLLRICGGGLLGLTLLAYVPLVAGRSGIFLWGDPTDASALLHYFSGADFRGERPNLLFLPGALEGGAVAAVAQIAAQVGQWTLHFAPSLLPLLLVVASVAQLRPGRHGLGPLALPLLSGLSLLMIASNTIFRPDNPDYLGYLAPSLWCSTAALGAGLLRLLAGRGRRALALGVAALALTALLSPPSILARSRHRDRVTRLLAEGALAEALPDAILVVEHDHYVAALLYLTMVERQRPDVVVLATGLSSSSWYWRLQYQLHPELRAFSLRGPGGRDARLRRFLDAHAERPVRFERVQTARRMGLHVCAGGWLFASAARCDPKRAPDAAPTRALAAALEELGSGSPASDGLITLVAYERAIGLLATGHPEAALRSLLAGVPKRLQPSVEHRRLTARDGLLRLPDWQRQPLLGDPGRNLFAAGLLLAADAQVEAATRYLAAAAATELPEALALQSGR